MSIQIKKKASGRKRFIKTLPLPTPSDWMSSERALKNTIERETNLQIVSGKTYLEVTGNEFSLMLEVIGLPLNPDQKDLKLADQEAGDVLVYELGGKDLFSLDFDELLLTSRKVQKALNQSENQLSPIFHIVFDGEKIGLHFFRQKDYIQNLL